MATQYTKVTPDEYNSARTQVVSVLGTSTTGTVGATQGYGQTVASSAVAQHQKVTEADLDNLRSDIVKTRTHQSGSAPTITNVSKDDLLAATLFNSYTTLAASSVTNKDVIAANQIETVTKIINTETYAAYEGVPGTGGGWKNNATHTITVNFDSANDARYFFNSGGSFVFSASRTGGTVAPTIGLNQNTSWTNLLNTVTTEARTFDRPDFYTLTDTFTTWYNKNATGTYAANYYRISIKSNVANNSLGGATQIQFKIDFIDAYNDSDTVGYDGVDGTLTSSMVEKSPKGVANGGAITVPKPFSYTSSPTTGFTESGTPIYITAVYSVAASPTSVTENSATVNFTFTATNYNTGNTVTFNIIASTTVSLSDFVQTGWTQGPDTIEGYKTLTRTATNTGTFSSSSCSVSIVTNPDALTEGTETFTIEATGAADGSGGGFPVTATFTVTDSSKTPTPGISLSLVSGTASAIIGEGYDNTTTSTYRITSSPLTGSANLTVYGFYLDLSGASGVSGYKLRLPDSSEITPGGTYYTFPTPLVLSPSSTYDIIVRIFSNSGPSGSYTSTLRVRSNGGSADGSGPNTTAPSYNESTISVPLTVTTPTLNFSITASSYSTSLSYAPGSTASGTVTLTLTNSGNARGTVSGYSVVSSSGGLSVSFNNSLNGSTITSGGSLTDSVGLGSNTAGNYFLTASVTGTNTYATPSVFSRSDIGVTVQQLNPEISVSASSVSQTADLTTPEIIITYTNIGQSTLTISDVTVTPGTFQLDFVQTQARSTNTLAPGASTTNRYTCRRTRIGSSTFSVAVTSNAVTNPTFTTTGTVTGTQAVPTMSIFSTNGSVTNSSSFTTKAVIKKESNIYVSFFGTQRAGCHPAAFTWEDGSFHDVTANTGITRPIDAMTNPNAQNCNTPLFGSDLNLWTGQGNETTFWRTGVGVLWVALKTGITDAGVQTWHNVPGRMGDGVNQSTNQIRVEVEIVPNPQLIVSPTFFTQGDNWRYQISGCVSNSDFYVLGSYRDRPSTITIFTTSNSSPFAADNNGKLDSGLVSSATAPVGSYNRFISLTYKGTSYTSNTVVFEIQSPAYFSIPDIPGYAPNLNTQFVSNTSNFNNGPVGTFNFYRRTSAGNGSYTVTLYAAADDVMEVIIQGISRGTVNLGNTLIQTIDVTVSDGFVHWLFVHQNVLTVSYFAAAIWVGTPPVFYAGTATNLGPSSW